MMKLIKTLGFVLTGVALFFLPLACEPENLDPENPQGPETETPPAMELDSTTFVWIEPNIKRTGAHLAQFEKLSDGSFYIVLPENDPYMHFFGLEEDLPAENTVFAFEYKAENPIDKIQCFFAGPKNVVNAAHSQDAPGVPATDEWSHVSIRIKASIQEFGWGKKDDCFRLDIGESIVPGGKVWMRNFCIRPMNAEEQAAEDAENNAAAAKEAYAQGILDYLDKDYASSVTSVAVGADNVTVSGTYSGDGTFFLAEIPVFEDMFSWTEVPEEYRHALSSPSFSENIDRIAEFDGVKYDRLLSKWAVYKDGEGKDELVSHAVYADPDKINNIGPRLERIELKNKKGLGGIVSKGDLLEQEIQDLNLGSATINLLPMAYMSMTQHGSYTLPHEYLGKTYYFDEARVKAEIDAPLQTAAKYGVSVAGILLVQNAAQSVDKELGALLEHPDYEGILYTMPNMTTPESVHAYAAMIDFFAERYSAKEMRISHWIVHNEIDGGVHWTNMGNDVLAPTYMDTFMKSMRMVYNIAHQYDPNAEAFLSLAHGWTEEAGGGWYKVTDVLDIMNRYSAAEGDFYWAMAYHSYGVAISEPRVWEDSNVSYSMSSPNVSMKNLEVLDHWVKQPENKYKGTIMRKVWLSEAGVGSGLTNEAYDEKKLSEQAAGFAYSWLKIQALEGIEGLQWHNWFDSKEEGAKLGLRKYEDTDAGDKKPVWYTYQKAGEEDQDTYFEEQGYAATVGAEWNVIHDVTE